MKKVVPQQCAASFITKNTLFVGLSGNVTHALDRLASNTIAQQQQSASPTSSSTTPPSFNNAQPQQQQPENKKRLIAKTELRDSPLSSELLDLLLVVRMIIKLFTLTIGTLFDKWMDGFLAV